MCYTNALEYRWAGDEDGSRGYANVSMVVLKQLSKTYSRGGSTVAALIDVNLEIRRREFCAFVGPSGCGKSTLLNLIAGLDRPTSGDIILDGRSTEDWTSAEWTRIRRETIGIVFQAFHLVPGLTAEENARFLFRFSVVMPKQMQNTMHNEQLHFGFKGVAGFVRGARDIRNRDDDVAEITAARFRIGLIGGKGEHIRWSVDLQIFPIQRVDVGIIR